MGHYSKPQKRVTGIIGLLVLVCGFFLFNRPDPEIYDANRVKVRASGIALNGIGLHFRPPEEAGYDCPGVRFTQDGSSYHYQYVRSRIGQSVPVGIPAEKDVVDGYLKVNFPFPEGKWESGDHVELIDSSGKSCANFTCE